MPVFFEASTQPLGVIKTRIGKDPDDLQIESEPFFKYLYKIIDPKEAEARSFKTTTIEGSKLSPYTGKDKEWISIDAFRAEAYRVEYNSKKLEIRVYVPPELRKRRVHSLMGYQDESLEDTPGLSPSIPSAYVNVTAAEDVYYGTNVTANGRQPLRSQLEGAANFLGVVFEANATVTERQGLSLNEPPLIQRQDVRVVKDYPSTMVRQSAGDLFYGIRGFQNYVALGGVQMKRDFRLNPTKLTLPSGEYELFLKTASKVSVFVNGALIRTLDLPSGRHDLRDFPIVSGSNDVKLEITDDLGRSEVVNMSYHLTSELLAPGTSEYSYSLGLPSTDQNGVRTYDHTNPIAIMYHRIGVSNSLSQGLNLQASRTKAIGGVETVFANSLGAFKFEPALSQERGSGFGGAIRGRYSYMDNEGPASTQRTLNLGAEVRTNNFASFNSSNLFAQTSNLTALDVNASYNQGLTKRTSIGTSLNYKFNRATDPTITNSFRASAHLGRRFDSGLSGDVTFSQSRSDHGTTETSLSIFLGLSFPKDNQFISASYDTPSDNTQLGWSYQPDDRTNGTSVSAKINRQPTQRGYSAQLYHYMNRGRLGVLQSNNASQNSANPTGPYLTNNQTSLQLSTAFVYAGGHFVLSRPVNDSFVIVSPVRGAKGQTVEINPRPNGSHLGSSGFFGSAVYPEMPSYIKFPLVIGTSKLRQGTMIDQDKYLLAPTYKSGFSIEVGTDATVNIAMNLLDPEGKPIPFLGGKITSTSNSGFEPVEMFSNGKGKVRARGFNPGKFELRLFDEGYEAIQFEIPESAEGVYDLGNLTVPKRKQ